MYCIQIALPIKDILVARDVNRVLVLDPDSSQARSKLLIVSDMLQRKLPSLSMHEWKVDTVIRNRYDFLPNEISSSETLNAKFTWTFDKVTTILNVTDNDASV
jgi:hypothetical protein